MLDTDSSTDSSLPSQQLALGLSLPDNALLETYYPGGNTQVLNHIKQAARGRGDRFLYIWGPLGSGCSHLLQGACHFANERGRSAMYLPLAQIHNRGPALLHSLERLDLVCLDDIQIIAANELWEEALFHLYNRIRESARTYCIIASQQTPKHSGIRLADLQSRLAWGVTYQVYPLEDEDKLKALNLRAKMRGLDLPSEVGHYILRRATRNMGELYQLLEKLDAASMAAQRRLTIPFIKSLNLF